MIEKSGIFQNQLKSDGYKSVVYIFTPEDIEDIIKKK